MARHALHWLQVITFFVVALVVYFCVVLPVQAALNKYYVSRLSLSTAVMPAFIADLRSAGTACQFLVILEGLL